MEQGEATFSNLVDISLNIIQERNSIENIFGQITTKMKILTEPWKGRGANRIQRLAMLHVIALQIQNLNFTFHNKILNKDQQSITRKSFFDYASLFVDD